VNLLYNDLEDSFFLFIFASKITAYGNTLQIASEQD